MKTHSQCVIAASLAVALLLASAGLAQTSSPSVATQMRAIVYRDYGSPDVLRLEEVDKPVPSDDQVLIKVRAASVNPLDWHFMRGTPYIVRLVQPGPLRPKFTHLGVDLAGQVEAVGKSVTQFKPGDEVFGHRLGAFAEYVCANEAALVLKPAPVSFEEAAAVPVAAVTALQGLRDKGHIKAGQKVLINGASGGVGTFAVQIAKSFGAEVTGVCSTRNVELVRSIGADKVIDYTREDFTTNGQRYDLILDMVGNHSMSQCCGALTSHGTLVMVGSADIGLWLGPLIGMLDSVVYSWFVDQEIAGIIADVNQADLATLSELMQAGKLKSVIDKRYRLSEVPEAIRYLEQGHARGKVVITLDAEAESSAGGAGLPASSAGSIAPELTVLAFFVIALGVPIAAAFALKRRFLRGHPGKRPFRWGYYFAAQSLVAGICLGIMLDSGVIPAITCGLIYGILAWCFARRQHWAWNALTILSFNPAAWIINFIYLRKRWAESVGATPAG